MSPCRSRTRRLMLAWALALGVATQVFSGPPAVAQDWNADGGEARRAEIIRRYREIVERNPEEGRIFEMLVSELGGAAGIERLANEYAEQLEEDPTAWSAAMLLGHLSKRLERYDEALAAYEQARALNPDAPMVYVALGGVYRQLDLRDESEEMYERALALTPGVEEQRGILRALADLAFDAREFDAASGYVARMVELEPGNADVRRELAGIFVRYQRYDDALEQYQAIVDGAGRDTRQRAMAMADMGDVLALMGRTDDAVQTFEQAMRLVERGYWLHRALEQRVIDAYRLDGRLPELVARFEAEWSRPDFDQLLLLADLYDEIGREEDALEAVRSAVRRDARSLDARLALIRLLERRGDTEGVIEEYQTLIRQAPNDSSFVFRLADMYRRLGMREEALATLNGAASRFSSNPSALVEIADRFMRLRETERAGEMYERLVRIEPDEPLNYVALGEYHFMEGRRSEAERVWNRILDVVPDAAEGHAMLGDVFSDHSLTEEAVLAYEQAREFDPENDTYLRSLAGLYEDAGRLTQALRLWNELLDRASQDTLRAEARQAVVRVYDGLGRLQEVIPDMRDAFYADTANREAGYLLGEAYAHLDQSDEAEETYLAILEAGGDDLVALFALERLYTSQNRLQDAIGVLTRIAAISQQRAREYYHRLAELSLRVYDDEQAIAFATLAVDMNPDDAGAQARLGDIYRQMQRLEEAIGAYRRAIELDDRAFPHYFSLADIFLALNRVDEADALYLTIVGEANDEVQVLRAGRRAIRIHQSDGSLESLAALLEPRVYEPLLGPTCLKLLIELYDALSLPLAQTAEFGPEEDRQAARDALERVGRRALRPLLDALASDDLTMRTTALHILSTLRMQAAALPVARLLDDPDASLRLSAAVAVARMADPNAVTALIRAVGSAGEADATIKRLLTWAIARSASPDASAWLTAQVTDRAAASDLRALAATGLGRIAGDQDATDALSAALFDESANVQLAAVWAAGASADHRYAPSLQLLLEHGRGDIPAAAATALAAVDPSAGQALADALFRVSDENRGAVGAALACAGASRGVGAQVVAFDEAMPFYDASSEAFDVDAYLAGLYRWSTLLPATGCALDAATGSAIETALGTSLQSPGAPRMAAFEEISRADGGGLRSLDAHLDQPGRAALHRHVGAAIEHARSSVVAATSAESPEVRRLAVDALGHATGDDVAAVLIARLADEDTVRRAAIAALGAFRQPDVVDAVAECMGDRAWTIRMAAARSLGTLGARPDLLARSYAADDYLSVRVAAMSSWLAVEPAAAVPALQASWRDLPEGGRTAILAAGLALDADTRSALADLAAQSEDSRLRAFEPALRGRP